MNIIKYLMSNWHQKLIMPGALALDKLELTELKARDTSCPKGKKVEDIQYILEQVQESSHVKELTQFKFRSTERRIRINSPYSTLCGCE